MNKRAAIKIGRELVNQKTARTVLRTRHAMEKEAQVSGEMRKLGAAHEELTFRQVLEDLARREQVGT